MRSSSLTKDPTRLPGWERGVLATGPPEKFKGSLLNIGFLTAGGTSWGGGPRGQNYLSSALAGDRSRRTPSMKRTRPAEKAPGRRRAQPGQKERAGGSPGSGSPRRKQAERRGRRALPGDRERGSAEKTCGGRRKKDGRASLREQRAPSKKEKEARRKEEMWKQLKKHRCVVTRLQARFSSPSRSCQPCSLP